jgi:hypothetical protein
MIQTKQQIPHKEDMCIANLIILFRACVQCYALSEVGTVLMTVGHNLQLVVKSIPFLP